MYTYTYVRSVDQCASLVQEFEYRYQDMSSEQSIAELVNSSRDACDNRPL